MYKAKNTGTGWIVTKDGKEYTSCADQAEAEFIADMSNNSGLSGFSVTGNDSITGSIIAAINAGK
jgi:hypothetical protein